MIINTLYGIEEAKKAIGLTIVIDVFRAATLDAYILAQGAKFIIPVVSKENAFELKRKNQNFILVGEHEGYKINGFDYGNSPSEILNVDFHNKIVVHRSSQGTQGINLALRADEIILGSFVTFSAIHKYVVSKNPKEISLLAMAGRNSDDSEFADAFINSIGGKLPKMKEIKSKLKSHPHMALFLNPNIHEFPKKDFDLCLELNKFNFVCIAVKENKLIRIIKQQPLLDSR